MNTTFTVKETTRRHQANRRLHALTRNQYFDTIPVAQVQAILAAHGFQIEPIDGIYCGAQGQIDPPAQVGERTWFCVSGSIWFNERTGGHALLARLHFGDVKHLITAKQDRLGRDTLDTIATIRTIWDLGIIPHFPAEGGAFPRTTQNELLFEIKASVAQYERNLIRDRTRAVMRHKFNQGQLTGNVPFGFDCVYTFTDGSTLVSARALSLDPESRNFSAELVQRGRIVSKLLVDNFAEQAVIHQMRAWRDQGWKLEQIAAELNRRSFPSKFGCQWQAGNVASVLASRHSAKVLASAISQAT